MLTHQQRWTPRLLAATLNDHAIDLAHFNIVMPFQHMSISNAVSARIALSNGLIVLCITLPLGHRLQWILMSCTSQPKPLNSMTLTHPHAVLPYHHVVSVNLIPLVMLTTTIVINVVALTAALTVTHTVMIVIMMTVSAIVPLSLPRQLCWASWFPHQSSRSPFWLQNLQIPPWWRNNSHTWV